MTSKEISMSTHEFKCGFVTVVGRPNVGKSTLTNALVGAKISIVSRKAQTTRHRINSVLTRENEQFVFVDTPGFQTRHGGLMNRMMNRVVTQSLTDVDVVLHVVEAGKWNAGDEQLIDLVSSLSLQTRHSTKRRGLRPFSNGLNHARVLLRKEAFGHH